MVKLDSNTSVLEMFCYERKNVCPMKFIAGKIDKGSNLYGCNLFFFGKSIN